MQYDLDLLHLKNMGRFHRKLIKPRIHYKLLLTSYLDQAFPELQHLFNGIHHKPVYAILKEVFSRWI